MVYEIEERPTCNFVRNNESWNNPRFNESRFNTHTHTQTHTHTHTHTHKQYTTGANQDKLASADHEWPLAIWLSQYEHILYWIEPTNPIGRHQLPVCIYHPYDWLQTEFYVA